jgi:hypothetical protein
MTETTDPRGRPSDAADAIMPMLAGYQLSQALYVVARLGVPDALAGGPRPVAEVAAEVGAHPGHLARVLRALAMVGVFRTEAPGVFALGPLGGPLCGDTPGSLRDLAITMHETQYEAFGSLLESVRQGRPAADLRFGEPFWTWLERRPGQVERFTRAMANVTATVQSPLLALYDIGDAQLVVDVGGADGSVLVKLLDGRPDARGVVFDLPHVVPAAAAVLDAHGIAERVQLVGGSFFDRLPAGGDRYVLSRVLHDWPDEACGRILANVREAIAPDGRLVVMEYVVPEGDVPHFSKMLDITMLAMLDGKERTESEWHALLRGSGFEPLRTVTVGTDISAIEAVPSGT